MALTVKQKELMDMLFEGIAEQEAIDKCHLTKGLYVQWVASTEWIKEYDMRLKALRIQTEIIISTFQPLAAAKLIQLTDSDKDETSRHACLDIIRIGGGLEVEPEKEDEEQPLQLSKDNIKKVREILANDSRKKKTAIKI